LEDVVVSLSNQTHAGEAVVGDMIKGFWHSMARSAGGGGGGGSVNPFVRTRRRFRRALRPIRYSEYQT